jgi:hypothetical protein
VQIGAKFDAERRVRRQQARHLGHTVSGNPGTAIGTATKRICLIGPAQVHSTLWPFGKTGRSSVRTSSLQDPVTTIAPKHWQNVCFSKNGRFRDELFVSNAFPSSHRQVGPRREKRQRLKKHGIRNDEQSPRAPTTWNLLIKTIRIRRKQTRVLLPCIP